MAEEGPFKLHQASSEFSTRTKDIFANLDTLEKKHKATEKVRDESPGARAEMKRMWKAEPDIVPEENATTPHAAKFKRPHSRPSNPHYGSKCRRMNLSPDYKQHPEKWTKYSLDDVSSSDMSEASNSKAAFAFLEERRRLREAAEKEDDPGLEDDELDGKIVFRKPSKSQHTAGIIQRKSFSKRNVTEKKPAYSADSDAAHSMGSDDNDPDTKQKSSVNELDDKCATPSATMRKDDVNESADKTEFTKFHFKKGNKKRNIRSKDLDDEDDG